MMLGIAMCHCSHHIRSLWLVVIKYYQHKVKSSFINAGIPKRIRFCCIFLGVLVICLGLIDIGTTIYGVYHAEKHCPSSSRTYQVYEGYPILLYEFLPYYVSNVTLSEFLEHGENAHNVNFYLVDDCSLQTTENTTTMTATNTTSVENITTLYLMPGSEISYNICALTDAGPQYGLRLEIFVLSNLEDALNFSPENSALHVYDEFAVCTTQPCSCHSFTFQVEKPSYYSLRFVLSKPSYSYSVWYNYTKTVRHVSIVSPPVHSLSNCSVATTSDYGTLPIDTYLPHLMNKHQCIIADVETNEKEKSDYLHIRLVPICINMYLILSSVFLSLGSIVVVVAVFCIICVCKYA